MEPNFSHSAVLNLTEPGYVLILECEDRFGSLFYSCDLRTASGISLLVARFNLYCAPCFIESLNGPAVWLDVGINRPFYFPITFESRDIFNSFLKKIDDYRSKRNA